MNKSRTLSTASLMLVLAACGSEQKPTEPTPVADAAYKEAMDKARSVEATLQQQKDNLDRTLQEHEHPTAE